MQQELFVSVQDLMKEYVKQAFADITDFVEFGNDEVAVTDINEQGVMEAVLDPVTGEPVIYKTSFVSLKDNSEVDDSLIQEVKKGKDGVSLKLYDKQKAMLELMKYLKDNGEDDNDQITIIDPWGERDG